MEPDSTALPAAAAQKGTPAAATQGTTLGPSTQALEGDNGNAHSALWAAAAEAASVKPSNSAGAVDMDRPVQAISTEAPPQHHSSQQHQAMPTSSNGSGIATDNRLNTSALLQYCVDHDVPEHRAFVLQALAQDGFLLEHLDPVWQDDAAVVRTAVGSSGGALQFASDRLRNDRQTVLAAIRQDPFALAFASAGLRANADTVLTAARKDSSVLELAEPPLFADRDFTLAAVELDPSVLPLASPSLRADAAWRRQAVARSEGQEALLFFVNSELNPSLVPGDTQTGDDA